MIGGGLWVSEDLTMVMRTGKAVVSDNCGQRIKVRKYPRHYSSVIMLTVDHHKMMGKETRCR